MFRSENRMAHHIFIKWDFARVVFANVKHMFVADFFLDVIILSVSLQTRFQIETLTRFIR